MKKLLTLFFIAQISIVYAGSAIINTLNLNGTSSNLVTDSTKNKIEVGEAIVAVGYFTVADADITDFTSFHQIGTSIGFSGPGYFDGNVQTDSNTLGLATGNDVYLVIGNNTNDITLSDEWLVFKTQEHFGGDPTPSPSAAGLYESLGTLIKGEFGSVAYDLGDGPVDAYSLVAVPEPSSFALLGLGACALIFRRKKA